MAKPVRARPARVAARVPKRKETARSAHLPSPLRYRYTPELLAHGRHRYEHTEDSIPDIALDFGIHKTTFQRLANELNWVRYLPPPRDLPAAVKLAAEAEALSSSLHALASPFPPPERGRVRVGVSEHRAGVVATPEVSEATPTRPPSAGDLPLAGGGIGEAAAVLSDTDAAAQESLPPAAATIERLHRDVLTELAAVERMRAALDAEPQSPLDAERTSRTLSSLTVTLQRIQRMQCGLPTTGADNDDDIPADLDAFRDALARRIEAFLASTPDEDAAGETAGARPDVPRA